jgi:uncharacterized membrane protein
MRQRMAGLVDLIGGLDARHRLALGLASGLVVGAAVFFASPEKVRCSNAATAGWNAFAVVILALAWLTIRTTPQPMLRARAQEEDFGRSVIFVFVVVAACASLFAVASLIRAGSAGYLTLGLATVVLSWSLIQTVFALRYAHAFYGDSNQSGESGYARGLLFPADDREEGRPDPVDDREECRPDYFDFAYFSFVIGMTCQVSDVQITSPRMRRLAFVQSVLAFGFNTIILALLINTVFDLVKGK